VIDEKHRGYTPMKRPEIPLDQKRLLSVLDVCALAHAGHTQVRDAIKSGELKAFKRGRSTVVKPEDLADWINSFPPYTPTQIPANTRPRHYRRAQAAAAPAPATTNKRAAAADRKAAVAQRRMQAAE
jgi:hypothetical protein